MKFTIFQDEARGYCDLLRLSIDRVQTILEDQAHHKEIIFSGLAEDLPTNNKDPPTLIKEFSVVIFLF